MGWRDLMRKASERRGQLVFLHLHKTGGSTIHHLLARDLPARSFARRDSAGNVAECDRSAPVISGHVTARLVVSLDGPAKVFTVLRDPRERLLSQIYFLKTYTREHLETYANERALAVKAMPLRDLLRDDAIRDWAGDYYVRRLDPLHDPAVGDVAPDPGRALAFLKSCTVVGVTPRLTAFASAAFPHFGIRPPSDLPVVNRRVDLETRDGFEPMERESPSAADEAIIANLTSNDRLLYEHALAIAP